MSASFCWECGKKLERRNGELVFREAIPFGFDSSVRLHVECGKNLGKPAPEHTQSGVKRAVQRYVTEGL